MQPSDLDPSGQASPTAAHPTRIAVIGTGNVGATFAYALLLSGLAAEIVLIDADRRRAEGEAMDLTHAVPFSRPVRVWAGDYPDCAGAAVTVIAAGTAQRPGEDRHGLLTRNAAIFGQIVPRVSGANPPGIILVATNPVDLLAYHTWRLSGLPPERVIGSGTILDTARFRALLAARYGVDPRSIHAFIAGEHGDSEVPIWSSANIAGMRLDAYGAQVGVPPDDAALQSIFHATRDAAYEIIDRKGATYYAVAAGLMRIVEAILRDQHTVLSVSSLVRGFAGIDDVYLSLPAVIARGGVERVLRPELTDAETTALRTSALLLREQIDRSLSGPAGA